MSVSIQGSKLLTVPNSMNHDKPSSESLYCHMAPYWRKCHKSSILSPWISHPTISVRHERHICPHCSSQTWSVSSLFNFKHAFDRPQFSMFSATKKRMESPNNDEFRKGNFHLPCRTITRLYSAEARPQEMDHERIKQTRYTPAEEEG